MLTNLLAAIEIGTNLLLERKLGISPSTPESQNPRDLPEVILSPAPDQDRDPYEAHEGVPIEKRIRIVEVSRKSTGDSPDYSSSVAPAIDSYQHKGLDQPGASAIVGEGPFHGLLYPQAIPYQLEVRCSDFQIDTLHSTLSVNDHDGYQNIEKEAAELVMKACKESPDAKHPHFRRGHCILVSGSERKPQFAISNRVQWQVMCKKLLEDFMSGKLKQCELLISREYFMLQLRPTELDEEDFISIKNWEMKQLMRTNIDKKKYMSKADFDGFVSPEMIQAIIHNNSRLRMKEKEKEQLIQAITVSGRILFAIFVHEGWNMNCLRKLIDHGFRDDNLPKQLDKSLGCCRSHSSRPVAVIEEQIPFSVYNFDRSGHIIVQSDSVVPILPVAVDKSERSTNHSVTSSAANSGAHQNPAVADDTEKARASLGEGAHARVYQVRIDPSHHAISEVSLYALLW